ncbi:MAG: response regulator, partial [Nitrospirota bacterium]|nr:response regulator [Nitrospirota bacterium]
MKKILIADDIKSVIEKEESFFNRENIRIFTSSSNEKALSIHKKEKVDLIITHLDTPQMDGETLCSLIRNDAILQRVSIVMVCSSSKFHIERQLRCRANAFLYEPLNLSTLFEKAHQLLTIAQRGALRAPIAIKVHGKYKDRPFLCISENISASGMLFHTDRIIDQGDTIICSFFLPNSLHFLTEAEIVRVVEKRFEFDTYHYGIRFSNLNSNDKAAIEKYSREKLRRLKAAS